MTPAREGSIAESQKTASSRGQSVLNRLMKKSGSDGHGLSQSSPNLVDNGDDEELTEKRKSKGVLNKILGGGHISSLER